VAAAAAAALPPARAVARQQQDLCLKRTAVGAEPPGSLAVTGNRNQSNGNMLVRELQHLHWQQLNSRGRGCAASRVVT
jgi:hypothetical protein